MLADIANRQAVNHKITLIIVNDTLDEALLKTLDSRIQVIRLNRQRGSHSLWPIIKLNCILLKIHPDIIHLHSNTLPKIILLHGKKLWYTVHALDMPMTYVERLHGIIAISQAVKDDIQKRCNKQVVVIPNGIDLDAIKIRTTRKNIGFFKIIQVGRLYHNIKGQDILIEAIALLVNKGVSDISVDFIGTGPSEDYLKKLAQNLKVEKYVNFLGLRNRDYIYTHLKDYDLMCHPARQEGFGLTVAEGMAAKLPVLVSMDGGPWEIIEKGRYGTGFIPENVNDCALKILEIKNNYEKLSDSIEGGYFHVKSHYSIDRMVDKYLEAYENY